MKLAVGIRGSIRWLSAAILLATWPAFCLAAEPLQQIDLRQVRLEGELGRRYRLTVENNLLVIDHERDFLHSFRTRDRKPFSYVGLGKQLDATVRFAYATQDDAVLALKKKVIAETIRSQMSDGYIGIFPDLPPSEKPPELGEGDRLEVWWDIHEMSYIIFGLVSDYRYFGNAEALAAARKAADYILLHRPATPIEVHVSTTGLELAFLALADATGEKKYRDYVNAADGLARWRGDVVGHAYNQLSVCLAQLELYRQNPDPRLLEQSHRVLRFLVEEQGLLVAGACSRDEGWHATQEDTGKTAETCATAYLIRWLDRLMRIEAKPQYGDLMERAIHNALFAAQSPDGRELRKYTPLTGAREFYQGEPSSDFKRDTYCCPNNFRRIIAELPGMLYYQSNDGIVVNLYSASRLELNVSGVPVTLVQETEYPSQGQVALKIDPQTPVEFSLRLRIPAWCEGATVHVNGEPHAGAVVSGSFCTLRRVWKPGDRVRLDLPMRPEWTQGQLAHAGEIALRYGPLVFCVNPERQAKERQQELKTAVANLDPKSPAPLIVAESSLSGPVRDNAIRPSGLCFHAQASGSGGAMAPLVFTEFADPGGVLTYVRPAKESPQP